MKRTLSLSLALLLALTACSKTAAQPTPAVATESPAVTAAPSPETTPEATPAPTPEPAADELAALPLDNSLSLSLSSGAGGWSSDLTLNPDGSFTGNYHDSDMGVSGEGYDATMYISNFTGRFTGLRNNGDGSWSLTLDEISTEKVPDEEWIEEETYGDQTIRVRYVSTAPYGLEEGKDFILFGPNTPVEGLDELFLSWWPGRWEDPKPTTLDSFGLWNQAPGYGFFGSYIS